MTTLNQNTPKVDCHIAIHYPAPNGFIAKAGYKVNLPAEEVMSRLATHKKATDKPFNYRLEPHGLVSVFTDAHSDPTLDINPWESILGAPLK